MYNLIKFNAVFLISLSIYVLILPGCATTAEEEIEQANKTAATLYNEAKSALNQEDYETAIQKLESLEARFPFGKYAQQAQLDIAYAYYKYEEPESAVAAADRFIRLYPRHPKVDYAYYLKGLVKFNQGHSVFDKISGTDPAKRDPDSARKSFLYFSQLVSRFPDSKYTPDAIERMKYLRNALARHELYAAQYYVKMGAYVAAANRAKYILQHFYMTPSTQDALQIMIDAYTQLGLPQLAADAQRVYDLNFPATN